MVASKSFKNVISYKDINELPFLSYDSERDYLFIVFDD